MTGPFRYRGSGLCITMEPAYRGIEEETVTRLPSKAFDEFLKALDRPVPQTARDLIGMEPDWL